MTGDYELKYYIIHQSLNQNQVQKVKPGFQTQVSSEYFVRLGIYVR